jgi:ABC-2 type transport system permease protein
VSLEGRTLWLLRSSPISMGDLLWAKFWVGTVPLLGLALTIVAVTDVLLKVTPFMFIVSTTTIVLMTFALCGLAIGFGTFFPQYETENAAQIPTSFGGLLYMMAAISLIGAVIVIEATPVYTYLSARASHGHTNVTQMILFFGVAATVCLVATVAPLRAAKHRLEFSDR